MQRSIVGTEDRGPPVYCWQSRLISVNDHKKTEEWVLPRRLVDAWEIEKFHVLVENAVSCRVKGL